MVGGEEMEEGYCEVNEEGSRSRRTEREGWVSYC